MKDEKKFAINVVESIKNPKLSSHEHDEIRGLGFDGLVIAFIDARNEIKVFLIASCHLNIIPTTKNNLNVEYIFENYIIQKFGSRQ